MLLGTCTEQQASFCLLSSPGSCRKRFCKFVLHVLSEFLWHAREDSIWHKKLWAGTVWAQSFFVHCDTAAGHVRRVIRRGKGVQSYTPNSSGKVGAPGVSTTAVDMETNWLSVLESIRIPPSAEERTLGLSLFTCTHNNRTTSENT